MTWFEKEPALMVGGPLAGKLCQVIKGSRRLNFPILSERHRAVWDERDLALHHDMLVYERAPLRPVDGPAIFRVKR